MSNQEIPSEAAQRAAQIARSMSRAGIGEIYHSMSLSDFGDAGKSVIAIMDEKNFKERIATGHGFNIGLADIKQAAFPYVVARAMRLMQIDCRVSGLLPLVEYLSKMSNDEDKLNYRFQNFEAADALVIPRFFEDLKDRPLSGKEFYRLESYLSERMDEGFSVTVQYSGKFKTQDWYSDYFINRLLTVNTEVVI